jgi:site-specific DNA-methyltransferase (adenine-specific)
MIKLNQIINADCMDIMKDIPDKYFELAIVDPPYGIGEDGLKNHSRGKLANSTKYIPKNWDNETPNQNYFNELFRVSKNQIIWGGNYFPLGITSCFIVWDKLNGDNDFADCELAWTSFNSAVRKFEFRWAGMLQGNMKDKEVRYHPTQKPVALYKWLLKNYAKTGDKILDTHGGSCSSVVACIDYGFEYLAIEKDKDYYDTSLKRIDKELQKIKMFS